LAAGGQNRRQIIVDLLAEDHDYNRRAIDRAMLKFARDTRAPSAEVISPAL